MNKSHDYDKILTRLLTILQRLYEGESLLVSELSEEFAVSQRTIQRDFSSRLIRFPITKEGQKWKMQSGHSISKKRSAEELLILDIFESMAFNISSKVGWKTKNVFNKIKNSTVDDSLFFKSNLEDITGSMDTINALQQAIKESLQVTFTYHEKPRILNPYKIVSFEGYWYLYGMDLEKNFSVNYYLKEVCNLTLTTIKFQKNPEILDKLKYAMNAWFTPNAEPFSVGLLADGEIAKRITRKPLSSYQRIVAQRADGSIEIEIQTTRDEEIIHEVKKWLPHLHILYPASIKEKLENMARSFLEVRGPWRELNIFQTQKLPFDSIARVVC